MTGAETDAVGMATADALVCAWVRSDACGTGLKMMLMRKPVLPLIHAVAAAIQAAEARGRNAGLDEAAGIADAAQADAVRRAETVIAETLVAEAYGFLARRIRAARTADKGGER